MVCNGVQHASSSSVALFLPHAAWGAKDGCFGGLTTQRVHRREDWYLFLPCPQSAIACMSWASICLSPAQTLAYSSELPLPMPVQCDDIEDGARVGVIAIQRGQVTMVRAVCTAGIVARPAGRVAESGRDAASCADTERNVVPNADANRGND